MSTWIKWWKSKFAWTLIIVILAGMGLSFLPAYFLDWGWIISICTGLGTGFIIRKLIIKKLDEISKTR
jgi:hypothetical protein